MPRPVVHVITERIYEEIAPVTYDDEKHGWALLYFIEGWTKRMQIIEQIARDTSTRPGWATVLDPDTAPAIFLDWLAVLAGTRLPSGASEATKRSSIKAMEGLKRGSPGAMISSIQRHLTGTKFVLFVERAQGSAWQLTIRTLDSETADPNLVRQAIVDQKPGGIVFTYEEQGDQVDYNDIATLYGTYAQVYEDPDYQNYADLYEAPPTPGD